MKTNINYILIPALLLMLACNGSGDSLEEKREELKTSRQEMQELKTKIAALEEEIADLDPDFAKNNRRATLITTVPVAVKDFEHFIEVAGEVSSRQNIVLTSEISAVVESIAVQEGAQVKKGDLLIRLDANTTQSSIEELQTALELASTVFERQANLWEQKIGTEIQYLEAKNRKEAIERQLATARVQLSKSVVRAPFSGTIEEVIVRVGETAMAGTQLLRLVGSENMFIQADVSEAYVGNFEKGDSVEVQLGSDNQSYKTVISSVGRVINKENRTFDVEVKLPAKIAGMVKPNQLAVVKIKDYVKEDAVIVPTNLIQSDNKGDYVYVVEKSDSVEIALKKPIERGMTYKSETLVEEGLSGGEELINQGFREVADGLNVKRAQVSL